MPHLFPAMTIAALPIQGHDATFPIRRIYCVGRNYADHAREMGTDPEREPPFFFCKANDTEAVVIAHPHTTAQLPYPSSTQQFDYEVELVVAIGRDIQTSAECNLPIDPTTASDHIYGYAIGLDMTRRDLQAALKQQGRPWEVGKAFDHAAVIGAITPANMVNITQSDISLSVNGVLKQQGNISQLIWSVPQIIANLSSLFVLRAGDLIFTGTPAGVGAVKQGDRMLAGITGLGELDVLVV